MPNHWHDTLYEKSGSFIYMQVLYKNKFIPLKDNLWSHSFNSAQDKDLKSTQAEGLHYNPPR